MHFFFFGSLKTLWVDEYFLFVYSGFELSVLQGEFCNEWQFDHQICVFISDDNLSEDDMKECEKEDALQEDEDVPHPQQFNKKKKNSKLRLEWRFCKDHTFCFF